MSELTKQGIPVVTLDHRYDKYTSVSGDNLKSAMDAVEHLIQLGHKKIGYIGTQATSMDRELGYRNALMLNGIEMDEAIIVAGRGEHTHQFSQYGYQKAKELVESRRPFTALFCSNDLIAIGAIKALEEMNRRVPEDIAVVGFDDISMACLYRPSLTTVKQPICQMAETVVEVLLEQIEKPEKMKEIRRITYPMELIIRQSSGV